jgi:hypothetical protein
MVNSTDGADPQESLRSSWGLAQFKRPLLEIGASLIIGG